MKGIRFENVAFFLFAMLMVCAVAFGGYLIHHVTQVEDRCEMAGGALTEEGVCLRRDAVIEVTP